MFFLLRIFTNNVYFAYKNIFLRNNNTPTATTINENKPTICTGHSSPPTGDQAIAFSTSSSSDDGGSDSTSVVVDR